MIFEHFVGQSSGFSPFCPWPKKHPPITAGFQARAVGKNADAWPVSDLVRLLLAVAKAKKVRFRHLYFVAEAAVSWSEWCYPPEN